MKKIIEAIKLHKKNIIVLLSCIIGLSMILGSLYIFLVPVIKINGNKSINLRLNETYIEHGATASLTGRNISERILIVSNIDNSKLGKYKIEYKLKNGFITVKEYRTVNVIDDIYPVIKLKGEEKKTMCPTVEYTEEGYTATDNYDGELTKNVEIDIKDTLISYKVKDSSGNETIATREIERKDIEKPKLSLKGSSIIYLSVGSKYNEPGINISDNCDTDISNKVKTTGSVDTSKSGSYTINYEVTDNGGNTTSINRVVVVYDRNSGIASGSKNGIIYLTFDDGPSYTITPNILKVLKEKNVKATFFVINADNGLNYLIKQAYNDGHTIGLHSYTHKYNVIYASSNAYFDDLNKISNKVYSITGNYSKIIRFPGGGSNTISRSYSTGIMSYLTNEVIKRGYHYFDWNISGEDAGSAKTKDDVYRNVVNHLSKSQTNVVLLHDFENNYKTLNALNDIIDYGINNGYIFEAIDMSTPIVAHGVNN